MSSSGGSPPWSTARRCRLVALSSCRAGGRTTSTDSGRAAAADERQDQDVSRAIVVAISDGVSVHVAALDDVIDSKRAANRPKDLLALPYLESLRDQSR